jgi:hypothetical protein
MIHHRAYRAELPRRLALRRLRAREYLDDAVLNRVLRPAVAEPLLADIHKPHAARAREDMSQSAALACVLGAVKRAQLRDRAVAGQVLRDVDVLDARTVGIVPDMERERRGGSGLAQEPAHTLLAQDLIHCGRVAQALVLREVISDRHARQVERAESPG